MLLLNNGKASITKGGAWFTNWFSSNGIMGTSGTFGHQNISRLQCNNIIRYHKTLWEASLSGKGKDEPRLCRNTFGVWQVRIKNKFGISYTMKFLLDIFSQYCNKVISFMIISCRHPFSWFLCYTFLFHDHAFVQIIQQQPTGKHYLVFSRS